MISYRYEKEREIALFLAEKMEDAEALLILRSGNVSSSEQALHLAEFYWRAVDELIGLSRSGKQVCGESILEEWSELLFSSFRSYLKSSGYSKEWDQASDSA